MKRVLVVAVDIEEKAYWYSENTLEIASRAMLTAFKDSTGMGEITMTNLTDTRKQQQAAIQGLEACSFECEAGPLKDCVFWQALLDTVEDHNVTT